MLKSAGKGREIRLETETIRVENGTDVILVLLHAKSGRQDGKEGIIGNTRLDKMIFLLEKETAFAKYLKDFSYEPYNFGPYSSEVFDAIQALRSAGLVKLTPSSSDQFLEEADRYQIERQLADGDSPGPKSTITYSLTAEGEEVASSLFLSLTKEERDELQKFKLQFNNMSLQELIRYVYKKYPEYTTESKIRNQFI